MTPGSPPVVTQPPLRVWPHITSKCQQYVFCRAYPALIVRRLIQLFKCRPERSDVVSNVNIFPPLLPRRAAQSTTSSVTPRRLRKSIHRRLTQTSQYFKSVSKIISWKLETARDLDEELVVILSYNPAVFAFEFCTNCTEVQNIKEYVLTSCFTWWLISWSKQPHGTLTFVRVSCVREQPPYCWVPCWALLTAAEYQGEVCWVLLTAADGLAIRVYQISNGLTPVQMLKIIFKKGLRIVITELFVDAFATIGINCFFFAIVDSLQMINTKRYL